MKLSNNIYAPFKAVSLPTKRIIFSFFLIWKYFLIIFFWLPKSGVYESSIPLGIKLIFVGLIKYSLFKISYVSLERQIILSTLLNNSFSFSNSNITRCSNSDKFPLLLYLDKIDLNKLTSEFNCKLQHE